MVLSMSRPTKRKTTGVYYFRKRVPADLVPIVGRREITLSLETKDPADARTRHAEALAKLDQKWKALRAKPAPLTQRQIMGLAGILYSELTASLSDEPGSESTWTHVLRLHQEAREAGKLEDWLGESVDELLEKHGLRTEDHSRGRLIEAVDGAFLQAAEQLLRNAQGDYAPDPRAERFPEWETPQRTDTKAAPAPAKGKGTATITGLLDGWWKEAQASGRKPKTLQSYKSAINRLVAFLAHDNAARVTPEDVVAYKDHRISQIDPRKQQPISAKTIKDGDLAGLKSVFGWAVANRLLSANPVAGITMKVGKGRRNRDPGFSDAEAVEILTASLRAARGNQTAKTHAAKRWVPWLCAYTGARVGEMAQLRQQDVVSVGGVWVIRITPEAGTVKNDQYREVPLHPHLIELGFPEFVQASAPGHLFLRPSPEGHVDGPRKGVTNRLAEFVRLEVGITDKGILPNHAWRHRLKTIFRDLGADPVVFDAIQGHSNGSVSSRYGEVSIKAKAGLIDRIPRILVDGDPTAQTVASKPR